MLNTCGRAHGLDEVYLAIEAVKASGIQSWSLDLISGLPGLDRDMWRHSLQEAIRAAPNHISVYDLQVGRRGERKKRGEGEDNMTA